MKKLTLLWLVLAVAVPTVQAKNGLVAYWPFDTDFTNAEGTADYDGTAVGRAVISTEDVMVGDGALKIDDDTTTKSHVSAAGDFVGPAPVVRTVVGWYKYSDISNDGSDVRNFIWETYPTYSLSFGIRDGSDGKYSQWYFDTQSQGGMHGEGPTVDDGLWHHAAVVWNGVTGTILYYHDGVLEHTVETAPGNNPDLDQAGFNIGTHRSADGGRNWDGYLDEIAIFDVELTAEQVAALVNDSASVTPLNLFELYPVLTPTLGYPAGATVYPGTVTLQWNDALGVDGTTSVWLGTDPAALSVVAEGLTGSQHELTDLVAGQTYYWKVTSVSDQGAYDSEVGRFEVYQDKGLVAYWPFDEDYRNVQGDPRFDGVEIDTGDCVSVSAEEVKFGSGALRINDNNPDTHGLVQIDPSPFFGGQKSMSITCWYNYADIAADGSTGSGRPFVFESAPHYVISYGTRFETDGMDMGEWYLLGEPGASDTSGPIDTDPNGWYHVALVYDATKGTMSYYYDGELRDEVVGTPYSGFGDGLGAHDVLNIGDYRAADGGRMFDGYIDDMAAFDVALTATQVRALYDGSYEGQTITPLVVLDAVNDVYAKRLSPTGEHVSLGSDLTWEAPLDVENPEYAVYFGTDPNTVLDQVYATTTESRLDVDLTAAQTYYWQVDVLAGDAVYEGQLQEFRTVEGLVAYYSFDENLWTFNDSYEYDGIAIGNPVISSEDVKVGTGALKIDDDGSGAHLVTIEPSPFAKDQKQVTVTGWFKFKDISGDGYDARPFVLESDDYHISYGTRVEGDMLDAGEWYFRGNPGWSDTSGPLIPLDEDQWHHFAMVYNAEIGYAEFYYDGELRDRYEADPGTGLNETSYVNIGDYRGRNGGRNFDGYIDDVGFFDIALNADQIRALAQNPETINAGNVLDQGL